MTLGRFALLSLLAATCGCGNGSPAHPDCRPSFRMVMDPNGDAAISSHACAPHCSASVAILGCQSDLESLSEEEMSRIYRFFRFVLRNESQTLLEIAAAGPESDLERRELCRRLEPVVGRAVATDVLVSSFIWWEYMIGDSP